MWLRQSGLEAAILKAADAGKLVFGICGGYQMLGNSVSDPDGVESAEVDRIAGMALLDMDTTFRGQKIQRQTDGTFSGVGGMLSGLNGMDYTGYEIHMGESAVPLPPVQHRGSVYGSYIHGIFDAPGITDCILQAVCRKKGIDFDALGSFDLNAYKQRQYDALAQAVRSGLDMDLVYRILNRQV